MRQKKDEEINLTQAPDEEKSSMKDSSEVSADGPDSIRGAETVAPQETCEQGMEEELPQQIKQIGRYEIICLLGEGGMGQVYKAYDMLLKRYVALKILRSDEPELIERFLREARTQAQD